MYSEIAPNVFFGKCYHYSCAHKTAISVGHSEKYACMHEMCKLFQKLKY